MRNWKNVRMHVGGSQQIPCVFYIIVIKSGAKSASMSRDFVGMVLSQASTGLVIEQAHLEM